MARRRGEPAGPVVGLYRRLVDGDRQLVNYRRLLGAPDRRWPEGEPIEVYAWQLPGRPSDYRLGANQRVLVHPDDSMTLPDGCQVRRMRGWPDWLRQATTH